MRVGAGRLTLILNEYTIPHRDSFGDLLVSCRGDRVRRVGSRRNTPWGVERLEVCPSFLVASHASWTSGHRRLASPTGASLFLNDMGKPVSETWR